MNRNGKKGYMGEMPVLKFLQDHGFYRAHRLRTQGAVDKGDIGGIDKVCIEIKNQSVYKFGEWMHELLREKNNSVANTGALVVKPKGVGEANVHQWWAVLTLEDYVDLLKASGYGPLEYLE